MQKKAGKAIDLVDDIADATKVIDKIDDVVDAVKTADKIDDIVDAAKTTDKLTDLADDISDGSKIGDEVVEGVFGLCFTADTLVKVEKGYIPIASIEKGMYVYSTNIETNEKAYKQVNEVFVNDARQLFHIKVRDTVIKTTAPHPFYVENKGWVEAKDLVQGDELRLSSGDVAAVQLITIHTLQKSIKVYNFSVEDWHTYYVSEEGVLVHNTGKNPCAADYVEGVGKGTNEAVEWTNHGFKHFAPKNMSWKDVVKSTKNGPAKYLHGTDIEALERMVWENGTSVTNGKNWKVMAFDDVIGATAGKETKYMRVEFSSGTIHGHPITKSEYNKLLK